MRIRTFGGLWIEGPSGAPALGPRRLALLALVAAAGKRGISRDRVIGILWPEAEEEQARHTLSQTIYTLKKDTGRDWITLGSELRLDPGVSSEVGDLKEALATGAFESVENLATGIFLDGFYLAGAPEFERWVEEERARLKSSVARALEQLAARADAAGNQPAAIRSWTLLTDLDPLSARYSLGRMRALSSAGDRASALAHARRYEEHVRRELDTEVDPAVRQLVATLRAEGKAALSPPGALPRLAGQAQGAGDPITPQPARRIRPVVLALVAPVVLAGAIVLLRPRDTDAAPILAVGDIGINQPTDTTRLASVLRDMLATSLSGIEGLQVVANSRLVELLPRAGEDRPGVTSDAARRAGATELIEGELTTEPNGLVLSLRRVALDNGVLRKGYVLRARDRYAVVDSAAAAVARDFGLAGPSLTVAQVRTASPAAYALYDEGLRAHYAFDDPAAFRLMTAALTHDSTFAMAAFYAWRLARSISLSDSIQIASLERIKRLMNRTAEPERLLIQASVSDVDAPLAVTAALTDTLSVKYPSDPDVQLLLGGLRGNQGDWAGAVAAYERAFALDSTAGAVLGPFCRVCFAASGIVQSSLWADSAEAAVRAVRRLIALQGNQDDHRFAIAEPLLRLGRRAEVETMLGRGQASGLLLRDLIRWGHYEEADLILSENALSLDMPTRSEGWWLLLISLRDQGRLREADTLIHLQRLPNANRKLPFPGPVPVDLALLGMEMGHPEQTIRAHRANVALYSKGTSQPALRARSRAWNLALAGTAYAAAGDTAVVRRLADSLEVLGRMSNWARDGRLHHMLHGLLFQMAGRHEEAVDAFRKSIFSITDGYTRTNLMLARSLLALRRPDEAIAVLRPAIRGGIDGSNTYVSRTELHEALAQAFEQAGQRDSALVHWRAVESGWRRADPQFRERYLMAKAKAGR